MKSASIALSMGMLVLGAWTQIAAFAQTAVVPATPAASAAKQAGSASAPIIPVNQSVAATPPAAPPTVAPNATPSPAASVSAPPSSVPAAEESKPVVDSTSVGISTGGVGNAVNQAGSRDLISSPYFNHSIKGGGLALPK